MARPRTTRLPRVRVSRRCTVRFALSVAALLGGLLGLSQPSLAQQRFSQNEEYYFPLNAQLSPGVAAYWSTLAKPPVPGYMQPLRVQLPSAGTVTFFHGSAEQATQLPAPAQVRVGAGFLYRLRIAELPEFPGIELYPSIEILDHLHPPAGLEDEYPIPVEIRADEIQAALDGRFVTKVIYLEQPELAGDVERESRSRLIEVPPERNALTEADQRGRPLVILRLGARLPLQHGRNESFFGHPAPLEVSDGAESAAETTSDGADGQ